MAPQEDGGISARRDRCAAMASKESAYYCDLPVLQAVQAAGGSHHRGGNTAASCYKCVWRQPVISWMFNFVDCFGERCFLVSLVSFPRAALTPHHPRSTPAKSSTETTSAWQFRTLTVTSTANPMSTATGSSSYQASPFTLRSNCFSRQQKHYR